MTGRGSSRDVTYLSGSSTSPARWDPCRTIGYRVNTTLATRGALSDVLGAMARVNRVSGLHLTYRGSTRIVPTGRNGGSYPADTDIVVAWVRPGQTAAIASNARQIGTGGASWRSWRLNGRTYTPDGHRDGAAQHEVQRPRRRLRRRADHRLARHPGER